MEQNDRQLLDRFILNQDEMAFETIVKHYGPMVMGVCQRMTQNTHDSEDAFQATFLVLARKASKLRQDQPLGGWLYQVAVREAMNVKTKAFKKHEESTEIDELMDDSSSGEVWTQLRPLLDEELARLPDKFRLPVLLCYLEGRTYEDAADQLGLAHSKLKSRLSQARDLLRDRLIRRGVVLSSSVALGALMAENALAHPSGALVSTTVKAATWAQKDPAAAAQWVIQLPEGNARNKFLSGLAQVWSLENTSAAFTGWKVYPQKFDQQ